MSFDAPTIFTALAMIVLACIVFVVLVILMKGAASAGEEDESAPDVDAKAGGGRVPVRR